MKLDDLSTYVPGSDEESLVGDDPILGSTIGSYRVQELLGRGGVGAVYLAEHPVIGARVAIKVLHENLAASSVMVARFAQEARAANLIGSGHIVRALDFGRLSDGRHFAILEYVAGHSLKDLLKDSPRFPISRALRLCKQIADAMAAAHAAGIVHRDLKPANLLVEDRPEVGGEFVKLLDFGVAKLVGETGDVELTTKGIFIGTPRYCAPEQLTGEAPVGPQSDIYAVGAILYEMLVGQLPFKGKLAEIIVQKSTSDLPPLRTSRPDLRPELCEFIDSMLSPDPTRRPRSMREVSDALAYELRTVTPSPVDLPSAVDPRVRYADSSALATTPSLEHPIMAEKRRMGPIELSVAAGLLGLAVVAGVFLAWPSPSRGTSKPKIEAPIARAADPPLAVAPKSEPEPVEPRPMEIYELPEGDSSQTEPAKGFIAEASPEETEAVMSPEPAPKPRPARRARAAGRAGTKSRSKEPASSPKTRPASKPKLDFVDPFSD